jgi:hypothetical protein
MNTLFPQVKQTLRDMFLGDIMNKIYKIFISSVCVVTIISTYSLFAGQEQRRGLVAAIGSLFYGETQTQQESVVDFLAKLHVANDAAFHQLFDYVVYKKGNLDFEFNKDLTLTQVLIEKNLLDKTGAPSESLTKTFAFVKAIIDDYNKENKDNCCKVCCGGCFLPWCRENGAKIIEFTVTNALALITVVAKNKIDSGSPKLTRAIHPSEIAPLDIEVVLDRLAGDPID